MLEARLKDELFARSGADLLPRNLPTGTLIGLTRAIAKFKDGVLDASEMGELWGLLEDWVSRLLSAQSSERLALFKRYTDRLLPVLADELDLWLRMEIVSRQIEYPTYTLSLELLFEDQFYEYPA